MLEFVKFKSNQLLGAVFLFLVAAKVAEGACHISPGMIFSKPFSCNVGIGRLDWQRDGNLVVYDEQGKDIWASNTEHVGGRLIFQRDGNLVIIDTANQPRWASGTNKRGANRCVFQDDRNFAIYNNHTPLWATFTNITV